MTEAIVTIEKLVHGGQGIGTLADGRRVFVWNALPGERLKATLKKSKRSHSEAIAEEILLASPDRITPRDEAYLSTSPWQIMTYDAENNYKRAILQETLEREHVEYSGDFSMHAGLSQWHYRNKMEYSFWADEAGLHLALFHRGSHGKQIVTGSSIAMPLIDTTANKVLSILNKNGIRGSQLKTVVVRASQEGDAVAALFVKDENFPEIPELGTVGKGVAVYYSTPKSPASVLTHTLYQYGDIVLTDTLNDQPIQYDVNSFFQVNIEIFNAVLARIQQAVSNQPYIDMYSGVGTIGLSIGGSSILVESDLKNCIMAEHNAQRTSSRIVHAPAEDALGYIDSDHLLIVDPPRAGLHPKVIDRIKEVLPPRIVYLSCNPITQARDLALLQESYTIQSVEGYNFFPRTPHIESLAILDKK